MRSHEELQVELAGAIKDRIIEISGDDRENPVYLQEASFIGRGRGRRTGSVTISCVFMNSDSSLCADLYRTGTGGCVDFFCGKVIDDMEEGGLREILYALESGKYSVCESGRKQKGRVRRKGSARKFLIPFFVKGA